MDGLLALPERWPLGIVLLLLALYGAMFGMQQIA
jgi:uncharacterized integral membrane protein